MKILVTGGNGFIGKALVLSLVRVGHDVSVLDLVDSGSFAGIPIHRFIAQDLSQPFYREGRFDFLFHLAAHNVTHVGDTAGEMYHQINVQGTKHAVQGATADHLIFLSTTKVYKHVTGVLDENCPTGPIGQYERSKLRGEEICKEYFTGKSLTILRSVNLFGPGQAEKSVIPVFINRALHHEVLEVFGPRRQCLQFLFIDDMVRLLTAIVKRGGLDGTFNVATDEVVLLEDLVTRIKVLCQSDSPISFLNEKKEKESRVSGEKIARILKWRALVGLDAALHRCKEYYLRHRY